MENCCGLTPVRTTAPLSCLFTSSRMGQRNLKCESEKTFGLRLIGKEKATLSNNTKQGINLLLPVDSQVFCHAQESTAQVMVSWEDKHHPSKCLPLPPSSPNSLY